MFVISPADELILMTYGAAPRISPRPTLDCLSEPKVPIEFPAHFRTAKASRALAKINNIPQSKSCYNFWSKSPVPRDIYRLTEEPETETETIDTPHDLMPTATFTYDFNTVQQINSHSLQPNPVTSSLPPTPPSRCTPRSSLKRSTPVGVRGTTDTRRISFSNKPTPIQSPLIVQQPAAIQSNFNYHNNIGNMQHKQSQLNSSALVGNMDSAMSAERAGVGGGSAGLSNYDYSPSDRRRSRSPSILIEPATPTKLHDPTQPALGPGWGRPMSPMDLPPEPSKSPTASNKSRLRPKLHIPLGRLGRSVSSETRESSRLREDLHLQVENPIFNSENLRQRNFDAFFESGEPVYKLHTLSPNTAPADSSSIRSYTPSDLNKCAGVYDSSLRGHGMSSHTECLFDRSSPLTPEQSDRNRRAKSVSGDDGGLPQKGDRCPKNTYLHCLIKLFPVLFFRSFILRGL